MFRRVLQSARPVLRTASQSPAKSRLVTPQSLEWTAPRFYATSSGLEKSDIQSRIMEVVKSFEKLDATKITATSSFADDLGLDSLDAVEVVMAIEEEFSIEIPDAEADAITTVGQAIEYIANSQEAR